MTNVIFLKPVEDYTVRQLQLCENSVTLPIVLDHYYFKNRKGIPIGKKLKVFVGHVAYDKIFIRQMGILIFTLTKFYSPVGISKFMESKLNFLVGNKY